MKHRTTEMGRRILLVLLVGNLLAMWAGVGVAVAGEPGPNPVRTLPPTVAPGEELLVTVTFSSPADDFNLIVLGDVAPDGWTVTVDGSWCSPVPIEASTPQPHEAEYIWQGSYDVGTELVAEYKVQVPADAEGGIYSFSGTLEFYMGEEGPFAESTGGDWQLIVQHSSGQVALRAHTTFETGCLKLIKLFDAPDGVDFPQTEVQVWVTGPREYDVTHTLDAAGDWEKLVCDIPVGTYTVQELTAVPGWETSYDPTSRQLEVTAGDAPGPDATMTIANMYTVIGISVTPSEIDFGEISPGTTQLGSAITVSNTGGVSIDVSAELEADTVYNDGGDLFYTQALKLNDVFSDHHGTPTELGAWTAEALGLEGIARDGFENVTTGLVCPEPMYAETEYNGTLIFWAVATDA
ncbi:MAG: hypothetical protein IBX67_03745 [Dehalococcoidia bacterium]|nr:hypothetical protein [Dehalococcoidia bacterium]